MAKRRLYKRDRNGKFARVAGSAKAGVKRQVAANRAYANRPDVKVQTQLAMTYANLGSALILAGDAGRGNRTAQSLVALHGAKAATSIAGVGSAVTRAGVTGSKTLSDSRKSRAIKNLDKFDRNLKTTNRALNVGLGVGYGSIIGRAVVVPGVQRRAYAQNLRRAEQAYDAKPQIARRGLSPTKPSRGGVYDISSMKGSRVRR